MNGWAAAAATVVAASLWWPYPASATYLQPGFIDERQTATRTAKKSISSPSLIGY